MEAGGCGYAITYHHRAAARQQMEHKEKRNKKPEEDGECNMWAEILPRSEIHSRFHLSVV